MRAKNEAKFLAEAYNTIILERVVDGELMCPEACCGAPVMECKCGPDCPHCNCHEIQKLSKGKDEDEEILAEWKQAVGRAALAAGKALAPHAKTIGKAAIAGLATGAYEGAKRRADRIASGEKGKEDNREIEDEERKGPITQEEYDERMAKEEAQRAANERARKRWEDPNYWKEFNVPGLGPDTPKEDEEYDEYNPAYGKVPKRTIRSFRDRPPRTDPSFKGQVTSSEDIDKIDLSKWRAMIKPGTPEYRPSAVEDIMKAVYRQYGKELPSVDSRDWEMSWDKKVRPWLKNKFPNS